MHLKEIDANLLVVFDALMIDASVTQTAARLGRSPSAISHSLANLRTLFGDQLFVRAGQRLVPTAKAREIAPTIHVLIAGMESLLRPYKPFDPTVEERNFILASNEVAEVTLVHPLRDALARTAPGITITWTPLDGADSVQTLRAGTAHLLVTGNGKDINAPDMHKERLFDDRLVTLARAGHSLGRKAPTPEAFAQADHIRVLSLNSIDRFNAALSEHEVECTVAMEASTVYAALIIALKTGNLVSLPLSLVQALENHIEFIAIKQPFPPVDAPVDLVWHSSNARDEALAWLTRLIKEIAPRAPASGRSPGAGTERKSAP